MSRSLSALVFFILLFTPAHSRADTQICGDHDGNGAIGVSDALRVLRRAVGEEVTLECPQTCGVPSCGDQSCDNGETCATCATDCGACSQCAGASDQTTSLDSEEQKFLTLLNAYRANAGEGAVQGCTSMSRSAQGHAEDMRDEDYFSITGKDGSHYFERACDACFELACGPQFAYAEAIGAGEITGDGMLSTFKDSSSIRELLLDENMVSIGIGRATGGGTFGTYWVIDLAAGTEASCN
jgi:uncharacterized protein YkwD